ncbi:GAF and ANTAR domain-containing protein [Streptomyces sp. 21So2-11]|uniref:GAF and ANTAR domain-containing protein n=1 Tax=Streptomyces sp. 21So2-11 TaxID=3144408 RepID=UPI00321C040F
MSREQQLAEAFVGLADTLSHDFDPIVLLDSLTRHCVDLLGVDAAGVMVAKANGELRTMAVSDERAAMLELFQLQMGEGPCLDAYRTGRPVAVEDLAESADRWPRLAPIAVAAGFRSVYALPLRVNQHIIGALNLLGMTPECLSPAGQDLAQALADVAAVGLVHWRSDPARPGEILTQVQAALAAKASVDIARGMLAEAGDLDPSQASRLLTMYSKQHGRRLTETAQALVRRTIGPATVLSALPQT